MNGIRVPASLSTEEMIEFASTSHVSSDPGHSPSALTRRVYDAIAPFYSLPTLLFHSKAHAAALSACSLDNGMRVLEVAIGSGEMLRRLVEANLDGHTIGVDLSPKMAARSQEIAGRLFPDASVQCQAADVRSLPFPSGHFDTIVCCYLFELIPEQDVATSLIELRRVLRPGGRLTGILVAQDKPFFNALYRISSSVAPAFWGRQRDGYVTELLARYGFEIETDTHVRQLFYSSRIVSATSAALTERPAYAASS